MAFCNDWWIRCRKMSTSDSWRPCCVKCLSLHYTVFGSDWVSRTRHHFCIRLLASVVLWLSDGLETLSAVYNSYNILQNGEKRQKSNRAIQGICAISYFCFHPLQSICCIKSILVKIQIQDSRFKIQVKFLRNSFDTFNDTDFPSQLTFSLAPTNVLAKERHSINETKKSLVKNSFRLNCVGL